MKARSDFARPWHAKRISSMQTGMQGLLAVQRFGQGVIDLMLCVLQVQELLGGFCVLAASGPKWRSCLDGAHRDERVHSAAANCYGPVPCHISENSLPVQDPK